MATFRSHDSKGSDRSAGDRQRHREKLREAIRENIADIISEESIIGRDRDRIIKVPIRGIKEYRFVFGENNPQVGSGDGDTEPGQVIGSAPQEGNGAGRAGDEPGMDYYETDVTLEELIEIMFEDLELPDMERKILRIVMSERKGKILGHVKIGNPSRRDRHQTAKNRVRGKIAAGVGGMASAITAEEYESLPLESQVRYFWKEDEQRYLLDSPMRDEFLSFRRLVNKPKEESNAVVFCIMDTSGSMDSMKKYLARSFFFLLYNFVRRKYQNVELVFIAHHSRAKEVTEDEFFYKGESGGTLISSGYQKGLEIIYDRYHPDLWNVYAFHCSDGDNFDSDNALALKLAQELCEVCNLFGYGEIKPLGSHYYESSMLEMFRRLEADNFQSVLIERKEDIWPSFKAFLARDRMTNGA